MTLPLALTMGDPAGIGPEITVKAWAARTGSTHPFMVLGTASIYEAAMTCLDLSIQVVRVASPHEAIEAFATGLPVMDMPLPAPIAPGVAEPANGPAVTGAIEAGVKLCAGEQVLGLVTNPITKAMLYGAGFQYPGHTEYLAALAADHFEIPEPHPVMMLAAPDLRVVPLTIHMPLRDVPAAITSENIVRTGAIMAEALARDFGCASPRIAVAGLNPHAGEDGTIGIEDRDVIAPAVEILNGMGIRAFGPLSADTLFHADARTRYDAALCMYHDQALIPIKTLDFERGVNVTLGLPFVRTSPDHGTAYDIAGKGVAKPSNLLAALSMAADLGLRRQTMASKPEVTP
jgi:4-hydroxythreonine-4-phosphate dehydrogenase